MDLAAFTDIIDRYGAMLVGGNTLLHEMGLPVPLLPILLVAGARSAVSDLNPVLLVLTVVVGMVVGNAMWYAAGRRHGLRVLKLLCRLAITPDSCVGSTEASFQRWGAWSLSVGKFIPGVSLVASPLAGAMGMPWGRFVLFNGMGGFLYGIAGVGAGMIFHDGVAAMLAALSRLGPRALAVVVAAFMVYLIFKAWQRYRVRRALAMARITPEELDALLRAGVAPFIVDLRGPMSREMDARSLPGAQAIGLEDIERELARFPRDRDIVFYCACPNEASSAQATKLLRKYGYTRVRPLLGGIDGWAAAGYTLACTGPEDACARYDAGTALRTCAHLTHLRPVAPRSNGCEACLRAGDNWTHLRVCLTCGHVGCCDDSKNRHASKHFHETGHPLIRSLEKGESWKWCYADMAYVDRSLETPELQG